LFEVLFRTINLCSTSFEQLCDLDPPVRVQDSCQAFLFVVLLPSRSGKDTGDLSKDANRMNRVYVCDDVAVCVLVLEKECAKVRLAALHHFFDGCDDGWIAHDDGFVEAREERTTGDW
jgi:hypothetical protein